MKVELKSDLNLIRILQEMNGRQKLEQMRVFLNTLHYAIWTNKCSHSFQSLIQWVLHEYLDITCVVYLDNIKKFPKCSLNMISMCYKSYACSISMVYLCLSTNASLISNPWNILDLSLGKIGF